MVFAVVPKGVSERIENEELKADAEEVVVVERVHWFPLSFSNNALQRGHWPCGKGRGNGTLNGLDDEEGDEEHEDELDNEIAVRASLRASEPELEDPA